MNAPNNLIVGRETETLRFGELVAGQTAHTLLNIFGPGGIGKSVVGQKLADYAADNNIPLAFVDGHDLTPSPDRILYAIKEGFCQTETLADAFNSFQRDYDEYLVVQDVLKQGGGVQSLFDVVGNLKDPAGFGQIVASLGKAITENTQRNLRNRFALERYLRGADKLLTKSLAESVRAGLDQSQLPMALLVDTYEQLEELDNWVCRTLARELPRELKWVVLGRNALTKVNFDWSEYGEALHAMPLPELPEPDAKRYLNHYGLSDPATLNHIYQFTGGYPLLLVLVRHLATEAGGWDKIGALENAADRDAIASQLLRRILKEERVAEVREFLEKGVVARWFDPETVSLILGIGMDEGRAIYEKLRRHSFVERHPNGLQFHDKIRELLLERLRFTSESEYKRLTQILTDYYAEKAGIKPKSMSNETKPSEQGKYVINIQNAQGLAIGDNATTQMTSADATTSHSVAPAEGQSEVSTLREVLSTRLNLEELRMLCADIQVDFDNLGGEGLEAKARELILHLERRESLDNLVQWIRIHRKDIQL